MMDGFITALSGRNTGFISGIFQFIKPNPNFTNRQESELIRNALLLRRESSDTYVAALLAAVESCPDIKALFPEADNTSYDLRHFQQQPTEVFGGAMIMDENGPPKIAFKPKTFPYAVILDVRFAGPDHVYLTTNFSEEVVESRSVTTSSGPAVYPKWSPELGISGGFIYAQPLWEEGASIRIVTDPLRYPYESAVEEVQKLNEHANLMQKYNLYQRYLNMQTTEEKLALTAVVVALDSVNL